MGRTHRTTLALLLAVVATLGLARPALGADYVDVPDDHWAHDAIVRVAIENDWLGINGEKFNPRYTVTRRVLARAVVRAFAPDELPDPALTFTDLPVEDPWFKYANIAAKLGWISAPKGAFAPSSGASKRVMDRALVRALGLLEEVKGLNAMATADGYVFPKPSYFGYMTVAEELNLNYNYKTGEEERDLYPWDTVPREYLAHALSQAMNAVGSWRIWSVQGFRTITLPSMSDTRKAVVTFALAYVGYPYVYAAEWYRKVSSGYCCGAQVQGGFDCSGFQWWVLKRSETTFPVANVRPYAGWTIAERRASLIAKGSDPEDRYPAAELKAADLVFFDADGDDSNYMNIDHGGIALGNGWFIHSSGSRGGVTIGSLSEGSWWAGAYVTSRRLFA